MTKLCIFLLVGIISLSGCMAVRTYTVEQPRKDTDIKGNQGFLSGTPKVVPKESRLGPTRKISVVEIEVGSRKKQMAAYKIRAKVDQEEAADQAGLTPQLVVAKETIIEEIYIDEEVFNQELKEGASGTTGKEDYEEYVIQKNDTLQKISHKFYGTTKKWKSIYEANKKVIKNPDKIRSGTKIRIPM